MNGINAEALGKLIACYLKARGLEPTPYYTICALVDLGLLPTTFETEPVLE